MSLLVRAGFIFAYYILFWTNDYLILGITIKSITQLGLFLLLTSLAGVSYSQIPQIERDALVALYNSTDGANWTDNTGWLGEAGTECDWLGVTCSSGVVTQLIFYDKSLTGTIPSELGNLSNLTYLYLAYNSLSGTIPAELGNLSNLAYLLLGYNSLSGTIPAELGNLSNLTYLFLAGNSLSGSIPSELGNLTKLTTFSTSGNSLTGSIPDGMGSQSTSKISSVERSALIALYNSTDGANWKNNFGWMGAAGTECFWSGVTCSSGSVSSLSLDSNLLTGTIPAELGNLTSLNYLSLGANSLSGSIPKELGSLANLTTLSLFSNSLSGSIPSELGNLTNLTTLHLYSNSLSGTIPSEVSDLPKLTVTNLGGNLFTGPGFTISATERDALIALYNSTDGANWKDNTGWLGEVGTGCSWVGVTCSSGSVSSLSLNNNLLTGTIPIELGNLTNLTYLNFQNNSLSGAIPSELGNLAKLTVLYLGFNSLSGSIPSELSNLTNLNNLRLFTWSAYTPPIPSSLKNLSNSLASTKTDIHRLSLLGIDSDDDGISDSLDNNPTKKAEYKIIKKSEDSIVFSRNNRVVNVISSSWFDELTSTDGYPSTSGLGKLIYEVFEDQFDILMLTPNSLGNGMNFAIRFKSDSTGLGKSSNTLSSQWGSEQRLMGSLYYQNPLQIAIGPGLHEIAHIWATPDMFLYEERSGHSGNSNLGGILGGWKPNTLKYLEDGNYQIETVNNSIAPKGWAANFLPYGNFELYLMGLFSQEEVGHDLVQANDFQWIDRLEGTFSASSMTTTTMEQFIEQNGPRTPNYLDSQKHFKALFVVVSEEPLTLDEWNLYNNKLAEFETKEDDGFNHRYNFWEATYGRASISFNQGDHLLASSLSGKYELTNTDKNILSYSTASFSVKILGGDRTVADTDNAAGESVSFTATVTDDEKIATTQWLVDGVEVATGLSASVSLPNGSTVVTFRATDNDGQSTTTTATITVEVPNVSPVVTITGGDRTLADSDKVAGESVSFTATATDNDGTIAATQWLVGGVEVAVGLSASVSLPNGSTVVTFKATDDGGKSSTTTATITVKAPAYTPTEEWPSPYNGVTPDSSLELAFNNVGIFNTSDATIYTCLRLFTNGVAVSKNGIGEFDIGLNVVSLSEATVQITKFREFNTIGALNEKVQAPDCSGKFETTTGLYTDIIQVNTSVLETVWSLIDSTNLILKLESSKELTAN